MVSPTGNAMVSQLFQESDEWRALVVGKIPAAGAAPASHSRRTG